MRGGKFSCRLSSNTRLMNSLITMSHWLKDDLTMIKLHHQVISITESFTSLVRSYINFKPVVCSAFSPQCYRFNVTSSLFEKTKGLTL